MAKVTKSTTKVSASLLSVRFLVYILLLLLCIHHQPPAPVIYNNAFCHRLGTSPRPLSPLRNAPPRQMEAHQYLSADPIPDSSDGSRRRAQRAHDQAQQSYVSQASIKQHSSNMDCIKNLIRCIGIQLICQHSPQLQTGGVCFSHRQMILDSHSTDPQLNHVLLRACCGYITRDVLTHGSMCITSSLVESHLAPKHHIARCCIQPQSYSCPCLDRERTHLQGVQHTFWSVNPMHPTTPPTPRRSLCFCKAYRL